MREDITDDERGETNKSGYRDRDQKRLPAEGGGNRVRAQPSRKSGGDKRAERGDFPDCAPDGRKKRRYADDEYQELLAKIHVLMKAL